MRDADGNVISNEYGPKGPLDGSPVKNGKVLWFVPQDRMHENYVQGEENLATFVYPRPPLFSIDYFDDNDKPAKYF